MSEEEVKVLTEEEVEKWRPWIGEYGVTGCGPLPEMLASYDSMKLNRDNWRNVAAASRDELEKAWGQLRANDLRARRRPQTPPR